MPAITGADITELLSAGSGSSGGAISGSTVTSGVDNNVWPDITDVERIAGDITYRKTFWKNNHATDPMPTPVMYIPTLPTSADVAIGLGPNSSDDTDPLQGNMTALSGSVAIALKSDGADTRVVTLYGLNGSGDPVTETVTLNGTSDAMAVNTYSKVYAAWAASTSGSRTITIHETNGSGTLRGTIGTSKKGCWLWVTNPDTKGAGIKLPDLAAGQTYGMWRKLTVSAGAPAAPGTGMTVQIEVA